MIFFSFDVKFRLFLTHSKKNRAKFQRLLQKVLWSIKSPFTTVSPCPSLVGKRLITGILLPFNYKATFKHAKTPVFRNIEKTLTDWDSMLRNFEIQTEKSDPMMMTKVNTKKSSLYTHVHYINWLKKKICCIFLTLEVCTDSFMNN